MVEAANDHEKFRLGLVSTAMAMLPSWLSACFAAGYSFSVATKNDGTLWAWGRNDNGQLGDGIPWDHATPAQVGSAADWTAISAGYWHAVGLRSDRTMGVWGANDRRQIGDGTQGDALMPVAILPGFSWTVIATGANFTLAATPSPGG